MAGNGFVRIPGGIPDTAGETVRQRYVNESAQVGISNGLATKTILLSAAGTYDATEVLGFMVLTQGSAAWTLTFVEDTTTRSIPQAALTVGEIYPFHLSAITSGTDGTALLFLPVA